MLASQSINTRVQSPEPTRLKASAPTNSKVLLGSGEGVQQLRRRCTSLAEDTSLVPVPWGSSQPPVNSRSRGIFCPLLATLGTAFMFPTHAYHNLKYNLLNIKKKIKSKCSYNPSSGEEGQADPLGLAGKPAYPTW